METNADRQLGNYRLMRPIGEGSFAKVYLGEHIYLQTQAAIKLLHLQLGGNTLDSFLTEARTVARLRHPNIVRLLEFGVESSTGTPFVVMEYAPNGTLRQRHPRGARLPLPLVLKYVKQIAAGLQSAHKEKLIHRDIKPENLLLGADDEVLLADFGIALIAKTTYQNPKEFAGTVLYMAPEQIMGRPRLASDQYALGVIAYEWLSGNVPFRGTLIEVSNQHLHVTPPPLNRPDIPPQVEQVIMTALAKEPRERFASIQAFANAFEQACNILEQNRPPQSPTVENVISTAATQISSLPAQTSITSLPTAVSPFPEPATLLMQEPRRRGFSPGRTALFVVLALLLIGSGGWFYLTRSTPPAGHAIQPPPTVKGTVSSSAQLYLTVTSATPTLDDSLSKNSSSNWVESALGNKNRECIFKDGAYSAIALQPGLSPCPALGTDFSDFAFQIQMTIKQGDEGGLLFRSDAPDPRYYPLSTSYYLFGISADGHYDLAYQGSTRIELLSGSSPLIKTSLGQTNQFTVIARGNSISLYINAQYLASIKDTHRNTGLLGVFAQNTKNTTEVVFQNARAWEL